MPDYNGIEIKTKLGYTNSYTILFNLKPSGIEMKELCMRYGYPDKETNKNILYDWPTARNNKKYYKYYQIKYYKLKNFNKFIELIEQGTIRISFKIGFFKSRTKKDLYQF
ncbi:unknown [Mycoplasma sp. CAG:776]|nr:unknown [Mycoplasma sp. CAG:776]